MALLQAGSCVVCGRTPPVAMGMCQSCIGALSNGPVLIPVSPPNLGMEPKPKPVFPKETSTTCLVGYRVWNLDREQGRLKSTFKKEFSWPFRKPLAKDGINDAGIHAMKSGKYILTAAPNPYLEIDDRGLWDAYKADVAGSVYLWGEIQEHTLGYTAEFAYPKELWMAENTDPLTVMQLEWNYGVPVTLRADLKTPHKEKHTDIFHGFMHRPAYFSYSLNPTGKI